MINHQNPLGPKGNQGGQFRNDERFLAYSEKLHTQELQELQEFKQMNLQKLHLQELDFQNLQFKRQEILKKLPKLDLLERQKMDFQKLPKLDLKALQELDLQEMNEEEFETEEGPEKNRDCCF